MTDRENQLPDDGNEQMEVRRQKLARRKASGAILYPNDFKPTHSASASNSVSPRSLKKRRASF